MAQDSEDTSAVAIAVTAPHVAPYEYNPGSGYCEVATQLSDNQLVSAAENGDSHEARQSDHNDYELDSEDEDDIFENEVSSSNPQDYTKSYNRQRRLLDLNVPASELPRMNTQQKPKANLSALVDDQITSLSRHAGKLKLDDQSAGFKDGSSGHGQERSDRATNEQVLDPRTRMILLQMINRGIVSEIHGCISTGKEANVYHAIKDPIDGDGNAKHFAIKVYKTSILHFKDRSKYVSGEFRFQKGFPKRSNRGMVRLWAEKEYRNLKRMHSAGLPVPEATYLKSHVLLMDFIGTASKSGKVLAAPLLRDIEFEDPSEEQQVAQWQKIYHQMLRCMRIMFQSCKLVHADLSEYNSLYHHEEPGLVIIDVSQSVELDHPRSLDFLRMDIKNVTAFFARKGVDTLTEPSVFEFVYNEKLRNDQLGMNEDIAHLQANPVLSDTSDVVFREQFIPQTLDQVPDYERAVEASGLDGGNALRPQHLLAGSHGNANPPTQGEASLHQPDRNEEDDVSPSASDAESTASDTYLRSANDTKPRGKRFADKDAKKEHKVAVKEEKREQRKTKMPKHMKKRLVNTNSRGHKK